MRTTQLALIASLLLATRALAQTPGDECSNAIVVTSGVASLDTRLMTPSANPPANEGCAFLNWNDSRDGWFRFDATTTGRLTLDFCTSDYDTSVVLYRGSCAALERIACDDDTCNPAGPTYQSRIDLAAVAPGTYFIRVGGYGGLAGNASMVLGFTPTVPTEGSVRAWGIAEGSQSSVPAGIGLCRQVDAGHSFNIALTSGPGCGSAANVCLWGSHGIAALDAIPVSLADGASAVDAGYYHALAIRASDSRVVAWGSNPYGQCNVPADLGACTQIAGGGQFSLALTTSGAVRGWGISTAVSGLPTDLGACITIAAGYEHAAAVRSDGTVRCWGTNTSGECSVPADLGGCTRVACGYSHTVALRAGGTVACWGSNAIGQCSVPAGMGPAVAITAFGFQSGAVLESRAARMWGNNGSGQTNVPADLGTVISLATGFAHTVALAVPDCNANGVPDTLELAGHDCNGNSRLDSCDAADDILEDCNANGLGDTCEKQLSVAIGTSQSNVGRGHPFTWTVANAVHAVAPVSLLVRGHGDFSSALEYVRIRIGSKVDVHALGGTTDCAAFPVTQSLTIDPEDFNLGIDSAGVLRVIVEPTDAVDAAGCNDGTWVSLNLVYTGASSADCNGNAVLDSCEIAGGWEPDANHNGIIDTCEAPFSTCTPDLNSDGVVNGADLGALLGAWGAAPAGSPADLDHDGAVNGADLGIMLGAWGACAN